MDVKGSALKHGVTVDDIRHATRNTVWSHDLAEGAVMIVGPARNGALLEVGINRDGDAFHAMPARARFLRTRGETR